MTKSAPSHTRGELKHLFSKPCQNHSIFEQIGRILNQIRAKLRMPGATRSQEECPAAVKEQALWSTRTVTWPKVATTEAFGAFLLRVEQ